MGQISCRTRLQIIWCDAYSASHFITKKCSVPLKTGKTIHSHLHDLKWLVDNSLTLRSFQSTEPAPFNKPLSVRSLNTLRLHLRSNPFLSRSNLVTLAKSRLSPGILWVFSLCDFAISESIVIGLIQPLKGLQIELIGHSTKATTV